MTTSQCRPRLTTPKLLHDGLEVEHLLDVAGDELAHLVDDDHQGVAGLATLHQLVGALGELAGRDVRPALGALLQESAFG